MGVFDRITKFIGSSLENKLSETYIPSRRNILKASGFGVGILALLVAGVGCNKKEDNKKLSQNIDLPQDYNSELERIKSLETPEDTTTTYHGESPVQFQSKELADDFDAIYDTNHQKLVNTHAVVRNLEKKLNTMGKTDSRYRKTKSIHNTAVSKYNEFKKIEDFGKEMGYVPPEAGYIKPKKVPRKIDEVERQIKKTKVKKESKLKPAYVPDKKEKKIVIPKIKKKEKLVLPEPEKPKLPPKLIPRKKDLSVDDLVKIYGDAKKSIPSWMNTYDPLFDLVIAVNSKYYNTSTKVTLGGNALRSAVNSIGKTVYGSILGKVSSMTYKNNTLTVNLKRNIDEVVPGAWKLADIEVKPKNNKFSVGVNYNHKKGKFRLSLYENDNTKNSIAIDPSFAAGIPPFNLRDHYVNKATISNKGGNLTFALEGPRGNGEIYQTSGNLTTMAKLSIKGKSLAKKVASAYTRQELFAGIGNSIRNLFSNTETTYKNNYTTHKHVA